jgi:Cupin
VADALSTVLEILNVQVASSTRFEAAGDWGLSFPQPGQLKVIAALAGQCWITAGAADPVRLGERDCLLLAGNEGFAVLSSPDQAAVPQPMVLPSPWPPVVYYQAGPGQAAAGPRTVLVSGRLTVDRYAEGLLLDRIRPAVRIDGATVAARRLGPVLDLLSEEAADADAPGSQAIRRQLTHVLLVQVLRAVMATAPGPAGWLAALADGQVGAALAAIHSEPGRPAAAGLPDRLAHAPRRLRAADHRQQRREHRRRGRVPGGDHVQQHVQAGHGAPAGPLPAAGPASGLDRCG